MASAQNKLSRAVPWVVLAVMLAAGFVLLRRVPPLVDEMLDYNQISYFFSKEWKILPLITMLPGYHFAMAVILRLAGVLSFEGARQATFGFSLATLACAYAAARALRRKDAAIVTLEIATLPILYLYLFLVYTDVFSLGCIFLAAAATFRRSYTGSAIACLAAIMVRQTNVLWAVFFFVWIYAEEEGLNFGRAALKRHAKRAWMYLPVFTAFALFLAVNRGVSIGAKQVHPAFHPSTGNILLALFVHALVFFPQNVVLIPRIRSMWARYSAVFWPAAVCVYVLFLVTFRPDHPMNGPERTYYLRNALLCLVSDNLVLKTAFFCVAFFGALSMAATALLRRSFYLLYPAGFVFLGLHWLVEPRYLIPFFALHALFRKPAPPPLRMITLLWNAVLAVAVLSIVVAGRGFP